MNKSSITATNISKTIHGRHILSDVSFAIEKNSLVSLIGPNGAGKSTLVKILLDFDRDYSGTVSIPSNERVAYIPQSPVRDPNPIPLSVREYLSIGTTPLYSRKTKNTFDFDEILDHEGVSTSHLDQSFWSLSGGERQRVAIARALLIEPTILVLDEPLSAVDYASRHKLYELIRHLQQDHDMTVMLVSHDIDSVLPISDRMLCLNETLHANCHPCDYNEAACCDQSGQMHHLCHEETNNNHS